ncbi:MAG: hypothetical protein IPM53_15270 [Anaerolineaceae bacterium]|nr:hypothetical protein [Anaerolineaceae bacterium]
MNRWFLLLCLASPFFFAACSSSEESETEEGSDIQNEEAANSTLTAVRVETVSLDADADFWSSAPKLLVPTLGTTDEHPDGSAVTVKAAYDGTNLIIRAEWEDPTMSLLKNAWTWDGTAFTKSGDEDRIMIHFPIENYPEFASKGCTEACHNTADDPETWYMATGEEAYRLDQWHWKAARTNPIGFADDKWVTVQLDPADVESAHQGDAKEGGGDSANVNEDGTGPAYMHSTDLSSQYILVGDEMPVDTSLLEPGMVIPGYLLAPLAGSRGDVLAQGTWENGRWVVVMMRALDTGNEDDVIFIPPRPVPFGLSIVDDGGGLKHTNAPEVLTLEWEQ